MLGMRLTVDNVNNKTMNRLRELDFLRGVAIILVLLRHQRLFSYTVTMGWIGVDLFFTLSGFLVSGLLFKEYLKFGDIKPTIFLLRRGFKIYPIYYLFYLPYIIPIILDDKIDYKSLISDLVFIQNYVLGWGYAYSASWSLAVEEHFYFGLAIFLWLGIKYKVISLEENQEGRKAPVSFQLLMLFILGLCLMLRLISNIAFPEQISGNFTPTHLRIDSLIAGVYISYLFHFKRSTLINTFNKYKYLLIPISFFCLAWTPFIEPLSSFFVKTVGFTLLYISFGITLLYFILTSHISEILDKIFTRFIVDIVAKIGYCSYSIYVIHTLVNTHSSSFINYKPYNHYHLEFFVTSILSITLGMAMTHTIEAFFLSVRNKYVPNRNQ
jgi:peptidoglycan/LPS O-acetylase OafA/YrhL